MCYSIKTVARSRRVPRASRELAGKESVAVDQVLRVLCLLVPCRAARATDSKTRRCATPIGVLN